MSVIVSCLTFNSEMQICKENLNISCNFPCMIYVFTVTLLSLLSFSYLLYFCLFLLPYINNSVTDRDSYDNVSRTTFLKQKMSLYTTQRQFLVTHHICALYHIENFHTWFLLFFSLFSLCAWQLDCLSSFSIIALLVRPIYRQSD